MCLLQIKSDMFAGFLTTSLLLLLLLRMLNIHQLRPIVMLVLLNHRLRQMCSRICSKFIAIYCFMLNLHWSRFII